MNEPLEGVFCAWKKISSRFFRDIPCVVAQERLSLRRNRELRLSDWALGSAGSERQLYKLRVGGRIPRRPQLYWQKHMAAIHLLMSCCFFLCLRRAKEEYGRGDSSERLLETENKCRLLPKCGAIEWGSAPLCFEKKEGGEMLCEWCGKTRLLCAKNRGVLTKSSERKLKSTQEIICLFEQRKKTRTTSQRKVGRDWAEEGDSTVNRRHFACVYDKRLP